MDSRRDELDAWCTRVLGTPHVALEPASADASFRRYFRVRAGHDTFIAMDAPPEHGDQTQFLRVGALLREAGLHAPTVHAADTDQGFVLMEDLGEGTYLDAMDADNADGLFNDAIDALVRWQAASRDNELPPYDRDLLHGELSLFSDWYLGRHMGVSLDARQQRTLEQVFDILVDSALAQPRVFVHRDYMPRNLIISKPNPGIVDFQDAVMGPLTYDLVSLFRDAFISWPEQRIAGWIDAYRDKARAAGLPVERDLGAFWRDFDLMGVQRHLKVIGIFARLHYRDGKTGYLADTPRFFDYLRRVAPRYEDLQPLLALLDELEADEAAGEPAA